METKYQSCGFGYNLGKTTSNLDSFYKNGSANSINLTSGIKSCQSIVYGNKPLSRFGKKRKFIQEAFKSFAKKGTKCSFTRWCKRQGYPKVTTACINHGKKNKSLKIRRKATFAKNIFYTNNNTLKKDKVKIINSDIKYLHLI